MLTSLALAAALAQGEVVAQQFTIRVVGPMFTAICVLFADPNDDERKRTAMGPRDIEVTIADGRLRCDTAKTVSVVKSGSEYIFIDHRSKEALVLIGDSGKSAACATTPFWPEAHGDATSIDELKAKSEARTARLAGGADSLGGTETDWTYFPGKAEEYRARRESGVSTYFGISTTAGVSIPNNIYHCEDNSGSAAFGVMWRATHSYAPGENQPKTVTVTDESFSAPIGYAVYVSGLSASRPEAKVLDPQGVASFLDRFSIPAVLPRSLLPGQG